MNLWKKKLQIKIINSNWELLFSNITVDSIPKSDEFININNSEDYYQVINVIHVYGKGKSTIVIVKPVENKFFIDKK